MNDHEPQPWLPVEPRVLALVTIAHACASAISLEELALLLPSASELDAPALRREISTNSLLAEKLSMVKGYVGLRGHEERISGIASREGEYRLTIRRAIESVQRVSRHVGEASVLGITGSVAFGTPKANDDIDLFLVAPRGRLWIELFKLFLNIKALNAQAKLRGEPSHLCLSFALDDEFCRAEFSSNRTAMFAREALNVIPVKNAGLYSRLLRENAWIEQTFPKLYRRKTARELTTATRAARRRDTSPFAAVADASLYLFFGLYVKLRAEMKRVGLRKAGRHADAFDVALSRWQWIFPHARYSRLSKLYESAYRYRPAAPAADSPKTPRPSLETAPRL